jgi:transposase
MSIITVGIDLAKTVFAVHGVDETGKPVLLKPKVSREQLVPLIAQLPPSFKDPALPHYYARNRSTFRD